MSRSPSPAGSDDSLPRLDLGIVYPNVISFQVAAFRAFALVGVEPVIASEDAFFPVVRCRLRTDSTATDLGSGSSCRFGVEGHRPKLNAESIQVFNIDSDHTCSEAAREARMYSTLGGTGVQYTGELLESLESEMKRQKRVAAEAEAELAGAAAAAAGKEGNTEAAVANDPAKSTRGKEPAAEPEAGPSGARNGDVHDGGTSPSGLAGRAQVGDNGDDFEYASPPRAGSLSLEDSHDATSDLSSKAAGKKREARAPSPTGREKRLKPERLLAREATSEEEAVEEATEQLEGSPLPPADEAAADQGVGNPGDIEPSQAQPDPPLAPATPMADHPPRDASDEEWEAYDPKAWLEATETQQPAPEPPKLTPPPERFGSDHGNDVLAALQQHNWGVFARLLASGPAVRAPPPLSPRLNALPAASPKLHGFFAAFPFEPPQQETLSRLLTACGYSEPRDLARLGLFDPDTLTALVADFNDELQRSTALWEPTPVFPTLASAVNSCVDQMRAELKRMNRSGS